MKMKIKKILVPIDGSKPSFKGLELAISLARNCGATITGMYVVSMYPITWAHLANPVKTQFFKEAREAMDRAELISAQKGIVFHKRIVYGDPKSSIIGVLGGR